MKNIKAKRRLEGGREKKKDGERESERDATDGSHTCEVGGVKEKT